MFNFISQQISTANTLGIAAFIFKKFFSHMMINMKFRFNKDNFNLNKDFIITLKKQ